MGRNYKRDIEIIHRFDEKVFKRKKENFVKKMQQQHSLDNETRNAEDPKMKTKQCIIDSLLNLQVNQGLMIVPESLLPANSTLLINIYGIHHNPSVYENPEVFDPDRFLPENYKLLHPYAFLAFSTGPRNCLGSKLAMIEMKMVLANVLRNFKVYSLDPQDKIVISYAVMLTPIPGIRMRVEKRRML
ncbi:cytochrome P450 4C1-like [Centruroides sculpturatus]|uniref:cytochrome P450 4C1-like n=1 Tax=Centruroides sculpturatus TaxID=218467 RepID=UPI000C6E218E|nr:cytochrome P450 4C1-like [Centruroides sculpturatus]